MAQATTGLVWHERFGFHNPVLQYGPHFEPELHWEHPATKRRIYSLIGASGLLEHVVRLPARPATRTELERFHTPDYLDRIESESGARGGWAGESTPFGAGSFDVASLAVGGCIEAVEAVIRGEVRNAYALVRPPGHHAERDQGRGFCLLANAALAVLHARAVLGVRRVAVVDWDVHHGNGTEQAFWDEPEVLTISVHQDRNYPVDTGDVEDRGGGAGLGANVNIPLPPGCGFGAYESVFDRIVEPTVRAHRPELVVVVCGFDAAAMDPLGAMCLTSTHFGSLARRAADLADEMCDGKLLVTHEGGYSTVAAPYVGLRVLEVLSGRETGWTDPVASSIDQWPHQPLQPWQRDHIDMLIRRLSEQPGAAPGIEHL